MMSSSYNYYVVSSSNRRGNSVFVDFLLGLDVALLFIVLSLLDNDVCFVSVYNVCYSNSA